MRLAILSRTLLLLVLPAVVVTRAAAQDHPNVQPSNVRDQLNKPPAVSQPAPAANTAKEPAPAPQAKVPAKAPAPAPQAKVPAKAPAPAPQAKAPAKAAAAPAPAKAPAAAKAPAKEAEKKPAKPPVEKPAEVKVSGVRRDPFDPLMNKPSQGTETP